MAVTKPVGFCMLQNLYCCVSLWLSLTTLFPSGSGVCFSTTGAMDFGIFADKFWKATNRNFFLFQRSTGTKHLLQTLKEYLAKTLHLGGILPFHPPKLWTILFYFDPVMIWLDMITARVKWQYSKTSKVEWPCRSMDPRNLSYSIYKERTTKPSSAWRSTQRSNQPVTRKVIGLPPNVLKLNYWVRLVCVLSYETNCTRKFTN